MNIDLPPYGFLEHKGNHFHGIGLSTAIGPVDGQIDGVDFSVPDMQSKILSVLGMIQEIDSQARAYFEKHASDDVKASGGLVEPSLLFCPSDDAGTFVLFYSGSKEDDDMCYGVDFQDYAPHDLIIGD